MPLFDVLPPDLFKPLAASSRRLYADLLLHLYHRTFELSAEAPRRADVMREIGDFAQRWEEANGPGAAGDELRGTPAERARALYGRLLETGWLAEHRDRYVRLVDLDPDASGLLHLLSQIERGETRSYGGAVLGVLSGLESAAGNPRERSENLANALSGATDFMAHMRTVAASLRKVEERILRQQSLRDMFRHFFEDFVERHLIRDYKTLHTKDNPFRFRAAIIRQANRMAEDHELLSELGEAATREGRVSDPVTGRQRARESLAQIVAVFEATEEHLAAIEATVARIERRIVNTARYMDRVTRRTEVGIAEAIQALARLSDEVVDVRPALVLRGLPLGPAHIPAPRREKLPVPPGIVREVSRDPATILYARAKEEYVRRTRVTAPALSAFVDKALAGREAVRGSEIPVASVDDFVAFQRLRELPSIFGGALMRTYSIEMLPERCTNPWISCQDFVIRRRPKEKRADAA
ncbi:Wadjet anti-phage system protein JetA family protein [Antarcticirhabdus aurantiaca]|uniref:DUF5716 family protein n=1 Tax=Antarcticirhabdus aurantiaca TaxID=2606717 RepID=A0ACD4NKZ4_9HYPH|nr:Wadjet anti-phage system protein JetA family protein [Antarcticirhabdus aurantiaca]WAJ27452.1 DUF5716 family protein [Jeongeuplla avenae]